MTVEIRRILYSSLSELLRAMLDLKKCAVCGKSKTPFTFFKLSSIVVQFNSSGVLLHTHERSRGTATNLR